MKALKDVLAWLGYVIFTFIYVILVELLISFVTLASRHTMSFQSMMKWAVLAAAIVGVIEPIIMKHVKGKKTEEQDFGDWHKQN